MWILVASHLGLIRRSLQHELELAGHKVVTAQSCKAARQLLVENSRIDVVIVEWKLADGTAFELHRESKQIDRLSDGGVESLPPHFIVLTTPSDQTVQNPQRDTVNANASGFGDVIEKPVDRLALLNRIREIGRSRLRTQPQESPIQNAETRFDPPAASCDCSRTLSQLADLHQELGQICETVRHQVDRVREVAGQLEVLSARPPRAASAATVATAEIVSAPIENAL